VAGNGPPVVLLHGLFGAGVNLGALARSLRKRYTTIAVDLPGHGRSPWLDRYDLPALADGVLSILEDLGLHSFHLVGHSLGGKVAMQLTLDHPDRIGALLVADIAPVAYAGRHDAVFDALRAVDAAHCGSREAAGEIMAGHLHEKAVIHFLLSSLLRDAGGTYSWRMDVHGLERDYRLLSDAPGPGRGSVQETGWPGPALFVKGETSDYIAPEHEPAIRALFPAADLEVMAGCGHWLHAENPPLFNAIAGRFLDGAGVGAGTGE